MTSTNKQTKRTDRYGLTTGVRVVTFIRDITGKIKNLVTEEDVKVSNRSSISITEKQRAVRKWVKDIGYRNILTDLRSIAQCMNGWWYHLGMTGHFDGAFHRRQTRIDSASRGDPTTVDWIAPMHA